MPFAGRGDRIEDQIALLRRLWCEERVTFDGAGDRVEAVGIAPLPPTRPIPLWLGALAPPALRRVGRVADGWFPQVRPGAGLEEAMAVVAAAAVEAGRDPAVIGMEGQILAGAGPVARHAEKWRAAGATHLSVNTLATGAQDVDGHIAALEQAAGELFGPGR
jgi:alkanesulfonate monooxygenase SsuD/methylene tetrahydromethanopterin reductase-like flavin-dependent oxidoreductase (luciferase family)